MSTPRRPSAHRREGLSGAFGPVLAGLLLLFAVGAFVLSVGAPEVSANGDTLEIYRTREGPYEIAVGILPRIPKVGTVHFSVTPLDAETALPVVRAVVTLTAKDSDGNAVYFVRAVNSPAARQYYDANILFEESGLWLIEVGVDSESLGESTVLVPLDIEEAAISEGLTGTIVWAVFIGVIAAVGLYLWRRQSRRNSAV